MAKGRLAAARAIGKRTLKKAEYKAAFGRRVARRDPDHLQAQDGGVGGSLKCSVEVFVNVPIHVAGSADVAGHSYGGNGSAALFRVARLGGDVVRCFTCRRR